MKLKAIFLTFLAIIWVYFLLLYFSFRSLIRNLQSNNNKLNQAMCRNELNLMFCNNSFIDFSQINILKNYFCKLISAAQSPYHEFFLLLPFQKLSTHFEIPWIENRLKQNLLRKYFDFCQYIKEINLNEDFKKSFDSSPANAKIIFEKVLFTIQDFLNSTQDYCEICEKELIPLQEKFSEYFPQERLNILENILKKIEPEKMNNLGLDFLESLSKLNRELMNELKAIHEKV